MTESRSFIAELKRRHVWRVAIAYAVVGWLLVQVATQVFPFFSIPNWVVRLVVILLVIGFPVVVVAAWAFEITPQGVRRTEQPDSPAARAAQDTHAVGRKLNTVIIAVLTLAVGLLLGNQFVWHKGLRTSVAASNTSSPGSTRSRDGAKRNPGVAIPDSAAGAAASGLRDTASATPLPASTAVIPEKSVAVLPFANESGKQDEQFFSDGLSDDLITALSQFDGLKVISRNSAFQFRDSKDPSAQIGKLLGVAHLLEGSVQRAGDEVRIIATLVNAADGTVVWTQRYDKPYQDLFALQDAITHAVADALKAKLLSAPGVVLQSDRPPSGNLAAYAAYQHGLAYFALGTEASFHQAVAAFHDAIRLDPDYAAAYAWLSGAWTVLAVEFLTDPVQVEAAKANARKASATALKLDPDSSPAHQMYAYLLQNADFDWSGAEAEYRRALQLAPNNAQAQYLLGIMSATLGQNRQAVELTHKALAADPRHAGWYEWLSNYLAALGQGDAAQQAITTAITLQPGAASYREQLAIVEILRGDARAALTAAQQEPPGIWHAIALALALQVGPDRIVADAALKTLVAKYATAAPYQIAEVYALRRDPDAMFQWLDRAFAARDPGIQQPLYDPLILRYRGDPRFAAFCKKVGLPTTTDAVAMK